MSFTLQVRVRQSGSDWFDVVEETVFGTTNSGGTWARDGDRRILQVLANSSGVLRFTNGAGDFVAFAVGLLTDQNVWTDIATNLAVGDTGVVIHPTWYGSGSRNTDRDWDNARSTTKTDSAGHNLSIAVTGTGNAQTVDITFS